MRRKLKPFVVQNPIADRLRQAAKDSQANRLQRERAILIDYLRAKTEAEDWHAVADVAMDLRELDARQRAGA